MPISAILQLEALTPGKIDQFTGRDVHAAWFARWRATDPAIGDWLHTQSQDPPFSLSPLMGIPNPGRGGCPIRPGQSAWLRVTCLSEPLEGQFKTIWLSGLESTGRFELPAERREAGKEIAALAWKVKVIHLEQQAHPWAATLSYEELSGRRLMDPNPPAQWQLEFATPTSFNSGRGAGGKDKYLPFPMPESLVKSWLRRWQVSAPVAFPEEELIQSAHNNLVVSSYRLHSLPVREGERLRVGCVGRLTLRALDMPPYLRAAVDVLAAYSFFCGSGSHTAQGMGQTRLIGSR
jgi:CRISPR-associated endoribonuclease Cas6